MKALMNPLIIKIHKLHRQGVTLHVVHKGITRKIRVEKPDTLKIDREVNVGDLLIALFGLLIIKPFKRLFSRGFARSD